MANENKKDFNKMLLNNKDMPKIQIIKDDNTIKKYGGNKMVIVPPIEYDKLMKCVPEGKLLTVSQMREFFAKEYNVSLLIQ